MSYSFDGNNDTMTGTFASTYSGSTLTIALYVKITAHPLTNDVFLAYGNSASSANDSHYIRTESTDNMWAMRSTDSAAASNLATVTLDIDNTWTPIVGVIAADDNRAIYIGSRSNAGTNGGTRNVADALQYIRVGEQLGGAADAVGLIAEVAIWNSVLSNADIDAYMSGTPASSVAAANLVGYWPLSADNATQTNLGVDTSGDLTVTSATYSADHPTIGSSNPDVTAVSDLYGGNVATVTGTGFGASRGSGQVYISPTDSIADANKVAQTILSWSDTSIVITVARGNLNYNTNLYLFVLDDNDVSNADGYVVQIKSGITLTWTA